MTFAAQVLLAYDSNDVKPGWIAFWIVMAMAAALAILMRSFAKQLKRIDFDENKPAERTDEQVRRDDSGGA